HIQRLTQNLERCAQLGNAIGEIVVLAKSQVFVETVHPFKELTPHHRQWPRRNGSVGVQATLYKEIGHQRKEGVAGILTIGPEPGSKNVRLLFADKTLDPLNEIRFNDVIGIQKNQPLVLAGPCAQVALQW